MNKDYEVVIRPNRGWFDFDFRELWHYRDLLFIFVRRDFVSTYKQTALNYAWFIIQPLLITLVFTLVFSKAIKIPTNGLPPVLFYLSGLLLWSYFVRCLTSVSNCLKSNADLLGKAYFPRLIIPISSLFSNFWTLAVQLAVFIGFCFYYKYFTAAASLIQPNEILFMLPLLIFQTAALAMGIGLWVTSLTVRYRDLQHLTSFVLQLWMFVTPVIYPASLIPEKWSFITAINPMAHMIEMFRHSFFGTGGIHWNHYGLSLATAALFFLSGIFIFNRVEQTFVDTI